MWGMWRGQCGEERVTPTGHRQAGVETRGTAAASRLQKPPDPDRWRNKSLRGRRACSQPWRCWTPSRLHKSWCGTVAEVLVRLVWSVAGSSGGHRTPQTVTNATPGLGPLSSMAPSTLASRVTGSWHRPGEHRVQGETRIPTLASSAPCFPHGLQFNHLCDGARHPFPCVFHLGLGAIGVTHAHTPRGN